MTCVGGRLQTGVKGYDSKKRWFRLMWDFLFLLRVVKKW